MLSNRITNTFIGFSKSFVNYIIQNLNISQDNFNVDDLKKIYKEFQNVFDILKTNKINFIELENR